MKHGTASTYRKGCRCEACRAHSALTRRNHRAGNGPGLTQPGPLVHGYYGYRHRLCRCEVCRAANAKMRREVRARKRVGRVTALAKPWRREDRV